MSLSRKVTGLFKKSNTIEQKIQQSASTITYRLGTEMVYVDRPASFEECIHLAQSAFPQLAQVSRERFAFSVVVLFGAEVHHARISRDAFDGVMRSLAPFEILDILVLPPAGHDSKSVPSAQDPPPQYAEKSPN